MLVIQDKVRLIGNLGIKTLNLLFFNTTEPV